MAGTLIASLELSVQSGGDLTFDLDDAGFTFEDGFSSIEEDDVIVVWQGIHNSAGTHSASGGSGTWTVHFTQNSTSGSGSSVALMTYAVTAADVASPPTYTLAYSVNFTTRAMSVSVWRGLDTSDVVDVSASEQDGFGTSATAPAVTTTGDDEIVMAASARPKGAAMTWDNATTLHNISPGGDFRITTHYETQASAGDTGTEGISSGAGAYWQLGRAAYKDASAAPVPPGGERVLRASALTGRLARRGNGAR